MTLWQITSFPVHCYDVVEGCVLSSQRCGRIYPFQSTVVAGYILSSPPLWQDISFPVHCCGRIYPFQSIVVAGYILSSPLLWQDISFPVHCCGSKDPFQSKSLVQIIAGKVLSGPLLLQERFFPLHHNKKDLFQPTIMHGRQILLNKQSWQ
jgi:hypothetical protein